MAPDTTPGPGTCGIGRGDFLPLSPDDAKSINASAPLFNFALSNAVSVSIADPSKIKDEVLTGPDSYARDTESSDCVPTLLPNAFCTKLGAAVMAFPALFELLAKAQFHRSCQALLEYFVQ